MSQKRDKNEIRDMVEDELLGLSKVMDVSESMRMILSRRLRLSQMLKAADITWESEEAL